MVTWIAADRSRKICSDEFLGTLKLFECVRVGFLAQYNAAVIDRLLLKVLTVDALTEELNTICEDQQPLGLYAVGPREGVASGTQWVPPVSVVGSLMFVFAAALCAHCRGRGRTRDAQSARSSGASNDDCRDAERGFLAVGETNAE